MHKSLIWMTLAGCLLAVLPAQASADCIKPLTVGWESWKPFMYRNEKGRLSGLDIELIRAVAWKPDDNIVRVIYASYLASTKLEKEAEQQLTVAASHAGDNAFTQHNIGLVYFDMKNYEKALFHAHKAYRGFHAMGNASQLLVIGTFGRILQGFGVFGILLQKDADHFLNKFLVASGKCI